MVSRTARLTVDGGCWLWFGLAVVGSFVLPKVWRWSLESAPCPAVFLFLTLYVSDLLPIFSATIPERAATGPASQRMSILIETSSAKHVQPQKTLPKKQHPMTNRPHPRLPPRPRAPRAVRPRQQQREDASTALRGRRRRQALAWTALSVVTLAASSLPTPVHAFDKDGQPV